MAIEIKDQAGNTHEVSSRGTVNAALATGIIGTALGVINGGVLGNGILNGNGNAGNNVVDKDTYFRDMINQINVTNAQFASVNEAICSLRERASVSETSNMYQNMLNQQAFGFVDTRFSAERKITDYEIAASVCRKIDGDLFLSPAKLGNGYIAPTQVLESHEARPYREGWGHGGGGCNPCYGGF